MSWEDDGVVLAVRRFGEHDAICTLLTAAHGRTAGMVKGGSGKNGRSLLQPGNHVRAAWRARLDSQLGVYTLESIRAFAAEALSSPAALSGVAALCAMAEAALPEREPHDEVYRQCLHLLEHIGAAGWDAHYVLWELCLLRDMGYGLDLGSCAATGVTEDLAYVSPRSGRAVSRAAAAPYLKQVLRLPAFLKDEAADLAVTAEEIAQGLALTGHFFDLHVFAPHGRRAPAARQRFLERFLE
ncbi:MAG: DNA repair protein RecO [Rhodospirillaceae bacterium]|nr:DNA repair protein RecO [Rhodospirillaceae bacterium]